jgi:tripartite-type tricarboxylate transporter receptor subunit TctC
MTDVSNLRRRAVLGAALGAGGMLASPALRADSYPSKPVRVVNAYSAGGTADVVCRVLCQALSTRLGQSFTVDNKPGAAGTVAANIVAKAPADGYTLLYDATAQSVNPSLFAGKLPYDTRRDLLPIFLSMQTPNTLMRNAQFEARTIPELIALAKARPGALDCASTGVGTVQHVSIELLNQRAGIKINHVPYREISAARSDLMAGRIPLHFVNVPGTVAFASSKEMTCMAHTGPQPIEVLPGVPAVSETLPGFVTWEWNGMFAPANTDSGLIARLNGELNQVIGEAAVKQRLAELGALTRANTVAEFTAFREQQIEFFAEIVKTANIRIE